MKKVLLTLLLILPCLVNAQKIVRDNVDKKDGKRYVQTSSSTRLDRKKGSTLSGVTFIQSIDGVPYMSFQMNSMDKYNIEEGYELTIVFTDGEEITLTSLAEVKSVKSGPTYTTYPAYEMNAADYEKIAHKEIDMIRAEIYSLKMDQKVFGSYILNKSASDSINKIFNFFTAYREKKNF